MRDRGPSPTCLNCGTPLDGAYCSRCGQRALAAYPALREVASEAWEELSGYDGRFLRTFRTLLARPGTLTIDTLEGRRARYIPPVRLYLVASVVYFLCAAAIPNLRTPPPATMPRSDVNITIDASGRSNLTPGERERALAGLERAPWWAKAILQPVVLDPVGFQQRFLATLPRVLFTLVPVFATIVALFHRGRPFTQHLIFALHLHTTVFMVLAVRELSQLAASLAVLRVFELGAAVIIAAYTLLAFRRVYRESWPRVLLKGLGVAVVYCLAGVAALFATTAWAAMRA